VPVLAARGVELAWRESGSGPPVLLIHETAGSGTVWDAVAEAISDRVRAITYDRRGWGESTAPQGYRRTTVEEQSEDAASLIESLGAGQVVATGAGVGGVIAFDLKLRRPELVAGMLLIEPPLLQLLPVATEALSEDRQRLHTAATSGEDPIDLYLSGGLPALGAGIARLPEELRSAARTHRASLLAELGLAAGWRLPLQRLAEVEHPAAIVISGSTPPLIRDAAGALAGRLPGSDLREVESAALPPHLGAPDQVAAIAVELTR
jgi:pimeloyl-ACP methyl ester carboxylesterase